jgi:hypothetical protein
MHALGAYRNACNEVEVMEWIQIAVRSLAVLSLSLVVLTAIGLIQPW